MSLLLWLPLTENSIQDKCGNTITTSKTLPTYNTSGKLGGSYSFSSHNIKVPNLYASGSMTFALWICFSTVTNCHILDFRHSSGEKGYQPIYYDPSAGVQLFSSTAPGGGYVATGALTAGTWYHIAVVIGDGYGKLYLNGEYKGQASLGVPNCATELFLGSRCSGANLFQGKMNDVRIYDHALSVKEVKELSKALVVHYTFDDVYAESTTNIITGIQSASGKSSLYGNGVKINWSPSGGDSYFMFNYNQAIKANSVYTLSFDCEGLKSGEVATFAVSNLNPASYNITLKNGRNSLTFTAGSDLMNDINTYNRLFFDDKTRTDGAVFYLTNFQLEEKDHATPYTPTSRESGMLVNETGYGGNGTLYNSNLSADTALGTLSCHTPRINPNSVNTMVSPTNSAYVYADVFGYNHTPTEFTVAWWWKVIDWGYGTGPFGLVTSNGSYMDSTLGVHDGAVYVNFTGGNTRVSRGFTGGGTGQWTHFAITFKPGSYTSYINGVSQGTAATNASLTLDPWRYLYLGAGCAGGCLRDGDIYWGDFRYYNTCLNDEDIKELYSTRWAANKPGQVFTTSVAEGNSKFQITKTGINNCNTLNESGLLPAGYTPLDGIKMERVPWINTGVIFNNASIPIHISADVTPTETSGNNCLAGCGNSHWVGPVMLNFCGGKLEFGTGGYSTSNETHGAFAANERMVVGCVVKSSEQWWYKNGERIVNITSRTQPTTTAPLYIGTFKTPSSSVGSENSFRGWIHGFEIKYGNIHKKFIPCKNGSVIGMYDVINHVFYSPIDGTYTAGKTLVSQDSSGSLYCNEFNEI